MSDRAAQLRTLATSFYRELMRLADEMDEISGDEWMVRVTEQFVKDFPPIDPAEFLRHLRPMDPAEDC